MTGAVLSTIEYGSPNGFPVVALHGAAGMKERWKRAGTEGMPQRRWICPDLRGYGESIKSPPWTLAQLAQDVVATLDSLRVETADLIGASLGGAVAFAVARLAPSRVRSVVVVDPPVSTREEYLSRGFVAPETVAAFGKSTSENLPPTLGEFAGDVLLLESGRSHMVTESGRAALRSQLGTRLHAVTFDDAGHMLLLEAFDRTVSEIEQFLGDVGQDARAKGSR